MPGLGREEQVVGPLPSAQALTRGSTPDGLRAPHPRLRPAQRENGRDDAEILRLLKRAIAGEVFKSLTRGWAPRTSISVPRGFPDPRTWPMSGGVR